MDCLRVPDVVHPVIITLQLLDKLRVQQLYGWLRFQSGFECHHCADPTRVDRQVPVVGVLSELAKLLALLYDIV